jgi:uncharacterized damage-inducible protein DinB
MSQSTDEIFLESARKLFRFYKRLGEGALAQLSDKQVLVQPNEASNSIALIVHHLSGNMMSRWTDFLTSDGEKPWRNREAEFEESYPDKKTMMEAWERGWNCLLSVMDSLTPDDLPKIIYIRHEGQTVLEAIQRQLAHYPHHVGQIVFQAKILKGDEFKSLSIPKGNSEKYNNEKFGYKKEIGHSTDRA